MTPRIACPAFTAAFLMAWGLSLMAQAQTAEEKPCSANATGCMAPAPTLSVSDRSAWPRIVVEAEPLKDKTNCPIQFVGNVSRRSDNLPSTSASVEQQLDQALGGAKAENFSKANVTAMFAQPGAFALDMALIPLKTLRAIIKPTGPKALKTNATADHATSCPPSCPTSCPTSCGDAK